MSSITLTAWKFDPSFNMSGGGMMPGPTNWDYQPSGPDRIAEAGAPKDLTPYLASAVLIDGGNDGMISGEAGDTFTLEGTVYDIFSVYNGDAAVIDGVTYTLVTFYGQTPSGQNMAISLPVIDDAIVPAFPGMVSGTIWLTMPNDIALPIADITCFLQGTLIETALGPRRIESLQLGDLLHTLDNGLQPLRWIGQAQVSAAEMRARPVLKPVVIRADALAPGVPAQDLGVSRTHRILLRSAIVQRWCGVSEVFVCARHLADDSAAIPPEGVTYYHLLLDRHEVLLANGAAAESFYTGPVAMRAIGAEAAAHVHAMFPDLASRPWPLARPMLGGPRARRVAQKHLAEQLPLATPLPLLAQAS